MQRRFEALCRQRGLAQTVQRRVIFAALAGRRDHPTADDVYELVRQRLPGLSRTTIYRVLEWLVRVGLAAKVCHPGAAARYDPLTHRHHHLVCLRCERVIDIEDPRLDRLVMPRLRPRAFEIQEYCVHFRGLCAACQAAGGSAKRRRARVKPVAAASRGNSFSQRKRS